MSPDPEDTRSETTVLTGGLRRVLVGVILVGFVLAATQFMAVRRLQQEIAHWASISETNGLRERLLERTRAMLARPEDANIGAVSGAFRDLSDSIGHDTGRPRRDAYSARFAALEAEARELFFAAEDRRRAARPHLDEIAARVDVLQRLNGAWTAQTRNEEQRILRQSEWLDARHRAIADHEAALTSALLQVQSIQQQIIAIDRLIATSSPEIVTSSIWGLRTAVLPEPCAAGEPESAERVCSPSSARVRASMAALLDADEDAQPERVRDALRAMEGYIRAGQARLRALAEEQAEALDQTTEVRERLADLKSLTVSLLRANRVLLDLDAAARAPMTTIEELDASDRLIASRISQARLRMAGILNNSTLLEGDSRAILSQVAEISGNWNDARVIIGERIDLLDAFGITMADLSSGIAEHAGLVRRDTTLWVTVYATTFVVLSAVLGASVIGLVWLARRRFVHPLASVTGTIIGLARGDLDRPFAVTERAFGFDRLGRALEHLRLEMIERRDLAERNRSQQKTIENNLFELERTNKEMEWLAMHDPLTGLGNRRHADLNLGRLTQSARAEGTDFCVMQIDIDRFKAINDALGHPAGDFVLKTVAGILTELTGAEARSYRIGGDEFLVTFPKEVPPERAAAVAEALIRRIDQPILFDGHRCRVGASIGIAFGRDADFDAMGTVMNADLALYHVKRTGRDGFVFFSDEFAQLSRRRKDISDRLLAAIDERAFAPFYQPQFHAEGRALRGLEVLCRWHDDRFGWIAPGEFLPVAQDIGVVGKIDEILFEKVADDLNKLTNRGLSVPRVSFNVTLDRLLKAGLAQDLSQSIGPHAKVAMELLESMSLDSPSESIIWAIDGLREKGIEIEIDDFGSDRASLAGLMAVKPQAMKIDRSIVIPITDSARHTELVKKIIDIGSALGIEVVAEGVETEVHAELLSALGCNVLQGFGLARPMPFDGVVELCRRLDRDRRGTGTRG